MLLGTLLLAAAPALRGVLHELAALTTGGHAHSHIPALELANGTHVALTGARMPCRECSVSMDAVWAGGGLRASSVDVVAGAALPIAATGAWDVLHVVVHVGDGDSDGWIASANDSARETARDVAALSRGLAAPAVSTVVYVPVNGSVGDGCDYGGVTVAALLAHGIGTAADFGQVVTTLPWEFGSVNGTTTCKLNGDEWAGLAHVGGRFSWVRARQAAMAAHGRIMLHEMGHNWGLGHAGSAAGEYADDTCCMGRTTLLLGNTFNGAMLQQLGWASAAQLRDGVARRLPALGRGNNDVLLLDDSVISFRGRDGHDSAVRREYRNTLYVHAVSAEGDTLLQHAGNSPWRKGTATLRVAIDNGGGAATVQYDAVTVTPLLAVAVGGALAGAATLLILAPKVRAAKAATAAAAATPRVTIRSTPPIVC